MANVPNSSLHSWVNSETITDAKLNQDVQVLQTAINDNDSRITTLQGTGWTNQTVKGNADALTTHKSSGDHDSRYYTQTQSDSTYATQTTVNNHVNNTNNPHNVTVAQIGAVASNDSRLHSPYLVGTHDVDEGLIADGKVLMYQASSGNIVYQSVPGLSGQTVVADGTVQTNLNADMVDNCHVGTAAGNIPKLDNNAMIPASMIPVSSPSKATANDIQITGTTAQTIATYTPTAQGNFETKIYYRVVTGTTNVTVQVTYTDGTGAQTNTVINAQSSAVGGYSCLPVFFNATTGSAIQIKVTASVANQVYASATIVGW